ncbi:hypothetical protein [Hypericibacter sp.]|uniref:hypothetical protein n=1 Tax=Hypericibacter sp. TaxID=2705401 RepID=UPI003D6DA100
MSLFKSIMPGGTFISGRTALLALPLLLSLTACDPNFPWIGPGIQYPGWSLPPVDTTITSPQAPPAPQAETEAALPQGPAGYFVWDPGHWHWTGADFVWIGGHYVERPYRGSTWVPGEWAQDKDKTVWIYTPGHWR